MKAYPSISGPTKTKLGHKAFVFKKYDGMNFRAEYDPKKGWHKFGSRRKVVDINHPQFGDAIRLFKNRVEKELTDHIQSQWPNKAITAYFEVFTEDSIGGLFFSPLSQGDIKLIDLNIYKWGMLPPKQFIYHFAQYSWSAEAIMNCVVDQNYIDKIKEDKSFGEGVVVKGGDSPNRLWSFKVKTQWWLDKIRELESTHPEMGKILKENIQEQKA